MRVAPAPASQGDAPSYAVLISIIATNPATARRYRRSFCWMVQRAYGYWIGCCPTSLARRADVRPKSERNAGIRALIRLESRRGHHPAKRPSETGWISRKNLGSGSGLENRGHRKGVGVRIPLHPPRLVGRVVMHRLAKPWLLRGSAGSIPAPAARDAPVGQW